jgi:hypothetical protein
MPDTPHIDEEYLKWLTTYERDKQDCADWFNWLAGKE